MSEPWAWRIDDDGDTHVANYGATALVWTRDPEDPQPCWELQHLDRVLATRVGRRDKPPLVWAQRRVVAWWDGTRIPTPPVRVIPE